MTETVCVVFVVFVFVFVLAETVFVLFDFVLPETFRGVFFLVFLFFFLCLAKIVCVVFVFAVAEIVCAVLVFVTTETICVIFVFVVTEQFFVDLVVQQRNTVTRAITAIIYLLTLRNRHGKERVEQMPNHQNQSYVRTKLLCKFCDMFIAAKNNPIYKAKFGSQIVQPIMAMTANLNARHLAALRTILVRH